MIDQVDSTPGRVARCSLMGKLIVTGRMPPTPDAVANRIRRSSGIASVNPASFAICTVTSSVFTPELTMISRNRSPTESLVLTALVTPMPPDKLQNSNNDPSVTPTKVNALRNLCASSPAIPARSNSNAFNGWIQCWGRLACHREGE